MVHPALPLLPIVATAGECRAAGKAGFPCVLCPDALDEVSTAARGGWPLVLDRAPEGVPVVAWSELDSPRERLREAQREAWLARPPLRWGQGIALVGGSGCGKSTLARALGPRLGLPVFDLDEVIARRAGKSIPRIFAEDGEAAFRALEERLAEEAFRAPSALALGGGAWQSPGIRALAAASGFAVLWIAEDPVRIWTRVARDPGRPLARDQEVFLERWRERMYAWAEAAPILPLGRDPKQLAGLLCEVIHL